MSTQQGVVLFAHVPIRSALIGDVLKAYVYTFMVYYRDPDETAAEAITDTLAL